MHYNEHHNHILTKELFERIPKQPALSPDVITQVRDAIDLKANSKLIQRKIQQSTGKNVTLNDISNIR